MLEHGRASPHAAVFDIDWDAPAHPGRLLLPILGQRYGEALRAGDIKLHRDPETGRPVIAIPGHTLPVAPGTVEAIDEALGPDALHAVLERQHYRLAHWRISAAEINYRRFFDIDELVGVRVEDPAVFDATHGRILAAVAAGQVQGLRIDHIDGLADPAGYLARLRQAVDAVRPAGAPSPSGSRRSWPRARTCPPAGRSRAPPATRSPTRSTRCRSIRRRPARSAPPMPASPATRAAWPTPSAAAAAR